MNLAFITKKFFQIKSNFNGARLTNKKTTTKLEKIKLRIPKRIIRSSVQS